MATELVNVPHRYLNGGKSCCFEQYHHENKLWCVVGSRSGSGLSMNVICGYCGEGHSLEIPYPEWQKYVKEEESE